MAFVLDACAALPWAFRDEATPATDRLFQLAEEGHRIYVPAHWPAEMLSGLTRAVRRGRLDDASVDRFLTLLPEFRFIVDARSIHDQWTEARLLILKHRLSAYDAAYLALARRQGVGLATLDGQLRLAAEDEGVVLTI